MKRLLFTLILTMIFFSGFNSVYANTNENDFKSMFDENGSIMMLIDAQTGSIEYANRAAADFYGYTVEQLESMKITDINRLSADETAKKMQDAVYNHNNQFEFVHRLANGELRNVEVYSSPHKVDEKDMLLSLVYDISERKMLEAQDQRQLRILYSMVILLSISAFVIFISYRKSKKQTKLLYNFIQLRHSFLNASEQLIYLKDNNYKYIFANKAFENFYQTDESRVIGKDNFELSSKEFAERIRETDLKVVKSKSIVVDKVVWENKTFRTTKFPVRLNDDIYGIGAYIENITEETNRTLEIEQMKDQLEESNNLLTSILESTSEIKIFVLDEKYRYVAFNSGHKKTMRDIWGKDIKHNMSMLEVIGRQNDIEKAQREFDRALAGESFNTIEEYGDETFARPTWQNFYAPIYKEDGSIYGISCFTINITERVKIEKEIEYMRCHDPLTGLYNTGFMQEEIKRLDVERNLPFSIIYGDLNSLKLTNDVYGHDTGDDLIKQTAEAIKRSCREDDIIARVGGDEFIILLPATSELDADSVLNRIINEVGKVKVKAVSAGIALGKSTKINIGDSINAVLKNAEEKMYESKSTMTSKNHRDQLSSILDELHERSEREKIHSQNVSDLCEKIAAALDLTNEEKRRVRDAGYYHDIGKIILDEDILNNLGNLQEEEYETMRKHTIVGYRILNLYNETMDIAVGALDHHEQWDGLGYPKGLKKDEISLLGRIIAVAESYDFRTNPYSNSKISIEEAIEEIREDAGKRFDPMVVDAFVKVVEQTKG